MQAEATKDDDAGEGPHLREEEVELVDECLPAAALQDVRERAVEQLHARAAPSKE